MYALNAIARRVKPFAELKQQEDPRILGKGAVGDYYDSPQANTTRKQQAR